MDTQEFSRKLELPVSMEEAFDWHERDGALDRLIPPWEKVKVAKRTGGIRDGAEVVLLNKLGPIWLKWLARHEGYRRPHEFQDQQIRGPFKYWLHSHRFRALSDQRSELHDHIDYRLPAGALGQILGGGYIRRMLDRMFTYRHATTRSDLEMHAALGRKDPMRIAITGSSGLLGSVLVPMLTTGGHRVTRLVRSASSSAENEKDEVVWDPYGDDFDASGLDGIDAVVHLAGKGIADSRWNDKVQAEIRDSRVKGTRTLCEALARLTNPPKVLVSASAVGLYGDRGDEVLTEKSSPGEGFLADVVKDWEEATRPAREAGIRVVMARFGMILTPRGGALPPLLTPFRFGCGVQMGNGRQYWSWISIDDAAAIVCFALANENLAGPINVTSPEPLTCRDFTAVLSRVLRRPAFLTMPAYAARIAAGKMADPLLLASARVEPRVLLEANYNFRHPTLESALRHLLGRQPAHSNAAG